MQKHRYLFFFIYFFSKTCHHYFMENSFAFRVTAARFDYEYQGLTASEIAEKYSLPLASVEAEISEAGWLSLNNRLLPSAKASSSLAAPNPDCNEAATLLSETHKRIDILDAYRIQEHLPYAIAGQKAVLLKAYAMLANMSDEPTRAQAQVLKEIHGIIESVLAKIPSAFTPDEDGAAGKPAPVQVLINNNVQ
jgi:hypothetical protein